MSEKNVDIRPERTWAENWKEFWIWAWPKIKVAGSIIIFLWIINILNLNLFFIAFGAFILAVAGGLSGWYFSVKYEGPSVIFFELLFKPFKLRMWGASFREKKGKYEIYTPSGWKKLVINNDSGNCTWTVKDNIRGWLVEKITRDDNIIIDCAALHGYSPIAIAAFKDILKNLALEQRVSTLELEKYNVAAANILAGLTSKIKREESLHAMNPLDFFVMIEKQFKRTSVEEYLNERQEQK